MYTSRMKQTLCSILLLGALAVVLFIHNVVVAEARSGPRLKSRVALIVDQSSGEIIYEKNASEAAPIASVTKLMTAMVIIDSGFLCSSQLLLRKQTLIDIKVRAQNLVLAPHC